MNGTVLRLERAFDAPREAVFDAWTSPEVLRRWWAAGTGWSTPVADLDLRVGGRIRLSMRDPAAHGPYTVVGEYREIVRPERLVYTWTWEGEPAEQAGSENTLVTVDFLDAGGRTTVVITHTGFAGAGIAAHHHHGWRACLDNLAAMLAAAAQVS
jgi:uncharacterized protein YndB with AHSA1/START domain